MLAGGSTASAAHRTADGAAGRTGSRDRLNRVNGAATLNVPENDQLYLQDIHSLIIEGGAHTLKSFIEAGLWDEARIFTGPGYLNKGIRSPEINGHVDGEFWIGQDNL